jgi:DNA-directed RNA polymerase subunit H (RpoH/RPB5)
VLGEMLKYRGYEEVSFMCKDHASLVQCMESDAVVALACSGSREDKAVVFHADVHVGVKALRSIVASDSFSLTARIVVSVGGPTSFARRDASASGVEFLTFKQIFNNISSHRLVPPHRRITCPDEQKSVAHRYCIATPSQWPRFRPSDPMCIFGDFREGDLIEIRRRSASGESMYYRMVS